MIKILEIGSGQGFNSSILSKNKKNCVTGVDISKYDISIAKKRYPNVIFLVMNAEKLKFRSESFDRVYAMDVLEHVDNIHKVVKEISRVLKKNGSLIVNIPHYKSERWLSQIRPTYFKEIHHVRVFKENELEVICEKYNLMVVSKTKKGFMQHIELYLLFKRKINSKTQLSIGSWRDTVFTRLVHVTVLYFEPLVLSTPLLYFPLWVFTLPMGYMINYWGNMFLPKSFYYVFKKAK